MIPADHIRIDGDTAWMVQPCEIQHPERIRPCDTCGGTKMIPAKPEPHPQVPGFCLDCDGTGRHTFTVEVECSCACHRLQSKYPGVDVLGQCKGDGSCVEGVRILRVHVLDVLPIVDTTHMTDDELDATPSSFIEFDAPATFVLWMHDKFDRHVTGEMPPAAAPGMWAVRLQIHGPENVEEPTSIIGWFRRQVEAGTVSIGGVREYVECPTCDGEGRLVNLERFGPDYRPCPDCTPENVESP